MERELEVLYLVKKLPTTERPCGTHAAGREHIMEHCSTDPRPETREKGENNSSPPGHIEYRAFRKAFS